MTRRVGRSPWVNGAILGLAGLCFVAMVALGVWQVQRLSWKLDLIAQVEERAYATALPAPKGEAPEYLRIEATGVLRHEDSLRVKAVTELGPGHWVMTPLDTSDQTIWVNRGFVPKGLARADWTAPEGALRIEGLVRLNQPGGTLLERNAPDADRWVSADLPEMSAFVGLSNVAPYFIAADHLGAEDAWPRGGMTKLSFRNTHLSYALTWFAMAALFLGAMIYVIRDIRRAPLQDVSRPS